MLRACADETLIMRIAVTGSSGFIGRHVCSTLAASGFSPVPLRRQELERSGVEGRLEGCDALIHLAGRAHVLKETSPCPEREYRATNVELTDRLARAAMRAGVGRLVFVSTAGVLGAMSPPGGFTDDSLPRPYDAYTRSKLEAERRLQEVCGPALAPTIIRPPLVYGPGAKGNFERLLRAVMAGWPLPIGAIDGYRSMIGLRNLTDILIRAATHPRAAGACMLAADEETVTVPQFVRAIADSAHRRARIVAIPVDALGLAMRSIGRSRDFLRLTLPFSVRAEEARRRIDWVPPYRMQDELDWTVKRILNDTSPAASGAC